MATTGDVPRLCEVTLETRVALRVVLVTGVEYVAGGVQKYGEYGYG